MSSALKFALILLAAAVLAMVARSLYVSNASGKQTAEQDVRILTAAADLPAGLLLRDGDLSWKSVPRSQVPAEALVERTPQAAVTGSLLRHQVPTGAVLKSSDMIRSDAPGFLAAALKPGMRAVSVPVNDVSGNAGLIQPGDYVDMILTQRMGGRGDLSAEQYGVVSETVVEHARIIAVGSSFQRESDASKPIRARTVTIEVSPRAAEAVTVASELGTLSLALRSFATTDRDAAASGSGSRDASVVAWQDNPPAVPTGPVWGRDVSRALDLPRSLSPSKSTPETQVDVPHRITIMRGKETQEQELNFHAPR